MREVGEHTALAWLMAVLLVAAALVVWPFVSWILFAIWAATLARPAHAWLAAHLGGRVRLAAFLVTLTGVLLTVPAIVILASLAVDAVALVREVVETDRVQSLLSAVPTGEDRASAKDVVALVLGQGGRAWSLAQQVAGAAAYVAIGLVIAIGGTYGLFVDGGDWYAWLDAHAPLPPGAFRRLADAVVETGRGLLVGIGGAGLAQAAIATMLYVALGVPEPLALGLLTLAASVVPAIGTAVVWIPVAIALAVTGRPIAALVLAAAGVLVIGTIDNLVRPYLARKGRLQLPTLVVALAMFGGVAALGARGVILGPLIVRLAKEVLAIWRERRAPAV